MAEAQRQVVWFEDLGRDDVPRMGGKNASLGEMVHNLKGCGISVPPGFATTADAYWTFVDANGLRQVIATAVGELRGRKASLAEAGQTIRRAFLRSDWPADAAKSIAQAYHELSARTVLPANTKHSSM